MTARRNADSFRKWRWLSVLGTAAALVSMSGCGGATARLQSHLDRGRAYFAKGDYAHATVEFRNAAQISPKDVTARLLWAHAAEKTGQVREAAGLYQSVIDIAPDNVEARVGLGRLFDLAGAPERALEIVEPALARHPQDASLLTVRALARLRQADKPGALADADQAIKLDPANADAVSLRAALYREGGDISRAVELVRNAVERQPGSTDLREVLVQLYASQNDVEDVETQLKELIKAQPGALRYREQLAILYTREHRIDDAQRTLEEAVKAAPADDAAKLALVSFVSAQRSPADGERLLRGLIAQHPDDYDLRFGLGEMLQRAGNTAQARATYEEIIQRDGTHPSGLTARDRIAAIEFAQGHDVEASRLVSEVLAKSPRDDEALLIHGEIAMKQRDPVSTIADLRSVLRDQPGSVAIQRLLAQAYLANGEPALAEQALRAALEFAPHDTTVRIELARLLVETRRGVQSVELLESTVHDDPADPAAREALVRAYLVKPDVPAARTAAEDLKSLRPKSPAGYYLAGLAAEAAQRPDEAQKNYEQALEIEPRAIDTLTALVRLDLARNRASDAIALCNAATQRDPKNPAVLNVLGELYLEQKDTPLALQTFQKAITLAPGWWPSYSNLAHAKLAARDAEGAIATYRAGIAAAPHEPRLVTNLAELYERQGKASDAIALYEEWIRGNATSSRVASNLAMLLVTYRKDQASLDRARDLTAAFASSNNSDYLDTNGWVHFKRAEYADALRVLEQAAAQSPDSREIRFHLGMTELQTGRNERARSDLEAALAGAERAPWSDAARSALASLRDRPG